MQRRHFIKLVASGAAITVVAAGGGWLLIDKHDTPLTIDRVLLDIEYASNRTLTSSGQWSADKVFAHCAQSIEYSMTGYPQHKSDIFKQTAGRLAFSLFSAKGKMTHNLSEPIPGAPLIASSDNNGLQRLIIALETFKAFNGELFSHFAFGPLSKREYEVAHVMHIYNHLQEITSY